MRRNPHCVWDRWPPLSKTHTNRTFTIFSNALHTQDIKSMGQNPDGAEWSRPGFLKASTMADFQQSGT